VAGPFPSGIVMGDRQIAFWFHRLSSSQTARHQGWVGRVGVLTSPMVARLTLSVKASVMVVSGVFGIFL